MNWMKDKAIEWTMAALKAAVFNFVSNLSVTSVILLVAVIALLIGPMKKAAGYASRVMIVGLLIVFVGYWWKAQNTPPPPPETPWYANIAWPWAKAEWELPDWKMPEWPDWLKGEEKPAWQAATEQAKFNADMDELRGKIGKGLADAAVGVGEGAQAVADSIAEQIRKGQEALDEAVAKAQADYAKAQEESRRREARKKAAPRPKSLAESIFGSQPSPHDRFNAICGYCGGLFFTRVRSGDNTRCPRCSSIIGARRAKATFTQMYGPPPG